MTISFTINKKYYHVNLEEFSATTTLNTYIRNHAELPGTKFMCLEGGCGCCMVTVRRRHLITNEDYTSSVVSCLVLLGVCDGWHITTIEGLGNQKNGYHPIQKRLAHFNGSQCGYCSPGMVMTMYSNLKANDGKMSAEQIENSFAGNLCRCTGYRPILDAMKSFAINSEYEYLDLCSDIEDLGKKCDRGNSGCNRMCQRFKIFSTSSDGKQWYYPKNFKEIFQTFQQIGQKLYILVAGNTGHGAYRRDPNVEVFIDINHVAELHTHMIGNSVVELGANITLTEMIDILKEASKQNGFAYCEDLAKHVEQVAHIAVRNIGTIAGNLSLKHQHNEFKSDLFLILNAVGATIHIASSPVQQEALTLPNYLNFSMFKKVITKISLPYLEKSTNIFKSYRVATRNQNAVSYVNAAFLIEYSNSATNKARLCFGGIDPHFNEAHMTASYLVKSNIFDNTIIRGAFKLLALELKPNWVLPDTSPEFRLKLACGLFYKFILNICPPSIIRPIFISGGNEIKRPISRGHQTYKTFEDRWPLTKPIIKLEALVQCSGEAFYMNDLPTLPNQLWAAFVPATHVKATILDIDPTEALSISGVVAFFSAKDIPKKNSFVTIGFFKIIENEEIFCDGIVKYHSQPVGIILAETLELAKFASTKVRITYKNQMENKLLSLADVFDKNSELESSETESGQIKSYLRMEGQYHFTMETQTALCIPKEDGIQLYSANHFSDLVQSSIAFALDVKENSLDFQIRRLGGSFGSKLTRASLPATACALACKKLNRPIRFVMGLESNMDCIGKRTPCTANYSVHTDPTGKIDKASINFYADMGASRNDSFMDFLTIPSASNAYDTEGWNIKGEDILTDAPTNTWFRAPGTINGIAVTETIMEHIARATNQDPADVRMLNISNKYKIKTLFSSFLQSTEYKRRKSEIETFNAKNRWRKRGIGVSIMKFNLLYAGSFPATVVIYHNDGSVCISHGGVEMGQGLNTKVAQVAAYTFGISLDMISVKPTYNVNGANAFQSAGSFTIDAVGFAVKKACEILLERMKPIRDQLKDPTWVEIVEKCYKKNISLIANYMWKEGDLKNYLIWGIAVTEVEIDVLTGDFQLNRVDILEDTGESISPLLDVGQVEGAFVMGLGFWLTEKLVYDRQTGELLTNRSWNYKIPGATDIPVDFRITLLENNPNPNGLLRTKATGEPAICLSVSALFALRHAIDSARKDAGIKEKWYHLGAPTTKESILLACGHEISEFSLN